MPPVFANTLSVRDFGARGNGTTDDTAAFNDAISAAKASGKALFIPSGTYILGKISIEIDTAANTRGFGLYGEGAGTTILKLRSTPKVNDALLEVFAKPVQSGDQLPAQNFFLRDLCFDGNGNDQLDGSGKYAVVSLKNLTLSEFTRLHVMAGRFRGIEDIGSATQDGDTPSTRNHYTDIRVTGSLAATRNLKHAGLWLENTKHYVLTNIIVDNWGSGVTIHDTGTSQGALESGGYHNINGLTVTSCPGDGLRVESSVWVSVSGFAAMAIGRGVGGAPVDGVPLRITSNDLIEPFGPAAGQSVFTNLVFRDNRNDAIVIEKGAGLEFIVIADVLIVNGRRGILAKGTSNLSIANVIFDGVGAYDEDEGATWDYALQLQDEAEESCARVTISNIQFYNCGGGLSLEGATDQCFAENLQFWLTQRSGSTLKAINVGASVGFSRLNAWNLTSGQISNTNSNVIIHYDGNDQNVATGKAYRVGGTQVVSTRQGAVSGADTDARLNDLITKLQAHGLIG